MIPPHLPPPSCDIKAHQKWQHIKIFIFTALLGLVGGVTGASIVLGWIWPVLDTKDQWAVSYFRSTSAQVQLEQRVREEIKDRIVSVYSDISQIGGTYYFNQEQKLGEGVVVSSDGWLVVYAALDPEKYKNWRVLTAQGKIFGVERALNDKYTGLTFLKIAQSGTVALYKQIEFSERISSGDDIFIYEDKVWQHGLVAYSFYQSQESQLAHLDSLSVMRYFLTPSFKTGSLVVNNQGRMVGIIAKDGSLLPSEHIQALLPTILTKQIIVHRSLGVEGWFNEEQPVILDSVRANGFIVYKVLGKQSLLKPGDVIIEANNKIVDPESLWYTIRYNQEVELKVLRQKKIISLKIPVIEI